MLYIIYDYFTPAFKAGGPIQSLENLVNVLKNEIGFSIVCSNKDLDDTVLPVVPDTWSNKNGLNVFYNSSGFKGVQSAIPPGSTVFINGLFTPIYTVLPALLIRGRKIVSIRGMLHPGGLSEKRLKKQVYLWLCRLAGLSKKCEFHASTELEKQYIQRVFGKKAKVWTIPNLPNVLEYAPVTGKQRGRLKIATVALISPMKNHLRVIEALGAVKAKIQYDIYGPVKHEAYWRSCLAQMAKLPGNIQVKYHGVVSPQRIGEVLENTEVYIQPSKSENFGHSLYEAMTKGRPVITSHSTPWNNLEAARAGLNIDPEDGGQLRAAIERFVEMEAGEFSDWSRSAREYALAAIDAEKIKADYINMFKGTEPHKNEYDNTRN